MSLKFYDAQNEKSEHLALSVLSALLIILNPLLIYVHI